MFGDYIFCCVALFYSILSSRYGAVEMTQLHIAGASREDINGRDPCHSCRSFDAINHVITSDITASDRGEDGARPR